jgi:hypothetical protein
MTSQPVITYIGIGGFIGAGKDTAAELLLKYYGSSRECLIDKFAKDLRTAVYVLTKLSEENMVSEEHKSKTFEPMTINLAEFLFRIHRMIHILDPSYSKELELLITDALFREGLFYWTDQMVSITQKHNLRYFLQVLGTNILRKYLGPNIFVDNFFHRHIQSQDQTVIISDVRFENELMAIKAHKGTTIYIRRPGMSTGSSHPSENVSKDFINMFDIVIDNNGSLEDLEQKLRAIF